MGFLFFGRSGWNFLGRRAGLFLTSTSKQIQNRSRNGWVMALARNHVSPEIHIFQISETTGPILMKLTGHQPGVVRGHVLEFHRDWMKTPEAVAVLVLLQFLFWHFRPSLGKLWSDRAEILTSCSPSLLHLLAKFQPNRTSSFWVITLNAFWFSLTNDYEDLGTLFQLARIKLKGGFFEGSDHSKSIGTIAKCLGPIGEEISHFKRLGSAYRDISMTRERI